MSIEAKRNELVNWVNGLGEEMLNKVEDFKKSIASEDEIVIYTTDGKGLTKKEYVEHINAIRQSVKDGAKTYTTEEVREFVLNSRKG